MISKEDKKILEKLCTRVRERFPDARIWAFGSRVRGDASWDSDFDTCIVLKHVESEVIEWIRKVAWEVGFEHERVITTVILSFDEFQNGPMSESALIDNILHEGIVA